MCEKIQITETALDCITMPWFYMWIKTQFAKKYNCTIFDVCNLAFEESSLREEPLEGQIAEREIFCTATIRGKKCPMIIS